MFSKWLTLAVLLGGVLLAAAFGRAGERQSSRSRENPTMILAENTSLRPAPLPPLDAAAPGQIATATFALG